MKSFIQARIMSMMTECRKKMEISKTRKVRMNNVFLFFEIFAFKNFSFRYLVSNSSMLMQEEIFFLFYLTRNRKKEKFYE